MELEPLKMYIQINVAHCLPEVGKKVIGKWKSGEVSNVILKENGYWDSVEHESECDAPDYWLMEKTIPIELDLTVLDNKGNTTEGGPEH